MRKEADAKRLQAEFGDFFTPLLFDVTDEEAVNRAAAEVRSHMKGRTLLGLVNNAGELFIKQSVCSLSVLLRVRDTASSTETLRHV